MIYYTENDLPKRGLRPLPTSAKKTSVRQIITHIVMLIMIIIIIIQIILTIIVIMIPMLMIIVISKTPFCAKPRDSPHGMPRFISPPLTFFQSLTHGISCKQRLLCCLLHQPRYFLSNHGVLCAPRSVRTYFEAMLNKMRFRQSSRNVLYRWVGEDCV